LVKKNPVAPCTVKTADIVGLGLIYQPLFLLTEALRNGKLVEVALDLPPPPDLGTYVMYPQSGRVAPKVRAMVEYLVARFRTKAPWDIDLPPRPEPTRPTKVGTDQTAPRKPRAKSNNAR
jgi:hypothetical protein